VTQGKNGLRNSVRNGSVRGSTGTIFRPKRNGAVNNLFHSSTCSARRGDLSLSKMGKRDDSGSGPPENLGMSVNCGFA
jgi:hypothetical protein